MLLIAVEVKGVGVAASASFGPAVVIHHLRHSRCHTARNGTLGGAVVAKRGAHIIIWRALVPLGIAQQRIHIPNRGLVGRRLNVHSCVRLHIAHLLGIRFEPFAHVVGNGIGIKLAFVAIPYHGWHTVVARHQHIAISGRSVESVIFTTLGSVSQLQISITSFEHFFRGCVSVQKRHRLLASLLCINLLR